MSDAWQGQELLDQQEQEMTTARIASAFVKAKKAFGPALKDKTNPAFRSKYADLGACIDAVEDALLDNGIAFIQETSEDTTGVTVETVFIHESGETMRCGKLHVPASKQDPQGYGSALTYSRRYSLMAACGIAPEDDDGNAASKAKASQASAAAPKAPTPPPAAPAKPGVIKPTDGAGRGFSDEKLAACEEIALYLIDCHRNEKDMDAIRCYYDPTTFADEDEKVYVWKLLERESKLRSTIKANDPRKVTA
jgi:hypothetical protein